MRTFTKPYLVLSLLIACGPTPGTATDGGSTGDPATTSTTAEPTTAASDSGTTGSNNTTTGTTGGDGPICSPSAFCVTDDDCPATAHCSSIGICATDCDPMCAPECMTADPPCPAPCDKQCATGCTTKGECMFCDPGLPGTTSDTGGAPACENTADLVFSPDDLQAFCQAHPFNRAPECMAMPMSCEDVLIQVSNTAKCQTITTCDYQACADALVLAECAERPKECDLIASCLVCTDDAGRVVPCPVQTSFCTTMFCDDFGSVALESGLDPEFADELQKVCNWNRCVACAEVEKACTDTPCPPIQEKCEVEMLTCKCG